MQINYIYLLLFGALLLTASCEDALQEQPETFYNEEQVFATEDGLEAAVNGIYDAMFSGAYYGSSFHGFIMPVSGKFWSSQGASEDATSLNTASNNTWLVRLWPQMYQTVNNANVVIQQLKENGGNLANRETALGQAHFLRALVYFDLVRFFGGVPLRTEPTTLDELHLPRASEEEVYALVVADLEMARDLLPAAGTYKEGRPTPTVARAYLARVFLDRASRTGNQEFYERAREEALAVYNSGEFSLTPTYQELFAFGNENTRESIFEIQYGHTGGIRNADFIRMYTPSNSIYVDPNVSVFGRVRPNKETYDEHFNTYPGDPRISATHIANEVELNNGKTATIYPEKDRGNDGYTYLRKYLDPTYNGTTTQRNMIHFRFADILLMLAEIENELNGPEAGYPYVNQVLARARDVDGDGASDSIQPMDWSNMSQDSFRLRILDERRFEMLGEGHVWFDTRRFGYEYFLEEVVIPHNTHPTWDERKDFLYPEDPKNMRLPIPQTELAGNQAVDVSNQNPGY